MLRNVVLRCVMISALAMVGASWVVAAESPASPAPPPAAAAGEPSAMAQHIAAAREAVDSASKALASNDVAAAKDALGKAQAALAKASELLGAKPPSSIVNARCPIMGGKINRDNWPADLVREYKGQKVAFCCGACPPVWDKLSDAEKDVKLKAAMEKK